MGLREECLKALDLSEIEAINERKRSFKEIFFHYLELDVPINDIKVGNNILTYETENIVFTDTYVNKTIKSSNLLVVLTVDGNVVETTHSLVTSKEGLGTIILKYGK